MIPQSMQDAIKAAAAKKKAKEWKEPVVKQVKVSAEDLAAAKSSGQRANLSAAVNSPFFPSAMPMAPPNADILRQIERERAEFRKEKDEILKHMNEILNLSPKPAPSGTSRAVVPASNGDSSSLSNEMNSIRSDIVDVNDRLTALESSKKSTNLEIDKLKAMLEVLEAEKNLLKAELEKTKSKADSLELENRSLRKELDKTNNWLTNVSADAASALATAAAAAKNSGTASMASTSSTPAAPTTPKSVAKESLSSNASEAGNKSMSALSLTPQKTITEKVSDQLSASSANKSMTSLGTSPLKKSTSSISLGPPSSDPFLQPFSAEKMGKYQSKHERFLTLLLTTQVRNFLTLILLFLA